LAAIAGLSAVACRRRQATGWLKRQIIGRWSRQP
jgi:hypothetical protein